MEYKQASFCPSCGTGLKTGSRFCASCGIAIEAAPPKQAEPQRAKKRWLLPVGTVAVLAVAALIVLRPTGGEQNESANPSPETTRAATTAAPVSIESLTAQIVDEIPRPMGFASTGAVSPDGRFIFGSSSDTDEVCAYSLVAGVEDICRLWDSRLARLPQWSPDGRRVAFSEDFSVTLVDSDIWVLDVESGDLSNLTEDAYTGNYTDGGPSVRADYLPSWGPNGRTILFLALDKPAGETRQRLMQIDLGGEESLIHDFGGDAFAASQSPFWVSRDEIAFSTPFDSGLGSLSPGTWALNTESGVVRSLVDKDEERGVAVIASVSPDRRFAAVFYSAYAFSRASHELPVVELLDIREERLYPLISVPDGQRRVGPYVIGFSDDSSRAYVVWTNQMSRREVDGTEMGTPTVSLVDLNEDLSDIPSNLHTVYELPANESGFADFHLSPPDPNTVAGIWTEDDRIVLARLDTLLVLQFESQ